jgi:predicted methyltransferase
MTLITLVGSAACLGRRRPGAGERGRKYATHPAHVARDSARHPVEELTFFGITPTMTVVELWPGGGYWTDILGPYLAARGRYYIALPVPGNAEEDAE